MREAIDVVGAVREAVDRWAAEELVPVAWVVRLADVVPESMWENDVWTGVTEVAVKDTIKQVL